MKALRKGLIIMMSVLLSIQVISVGALSSIDNIEIDASNYNQYREQLELEANGDNIIDRTTYKDYTFGKYANAHIDGWNVNILSTEVGSDGVHTVKFKAVDGYVLPKENPTSDTRFVKSSTFGLTEKSYTIEGEIGIVKYKPDMNKFNKVSNYVAPPTLVVRLVAIKKGVTESTYLKDYSFVEVTHQGIDFNNTEGYTGISPVVVGSRTYLVKKNAPLKVYYMNQEHHKPIETQPSTTGVSYKHDDYRNRYIVITDTRTDTMNKTLAYETTIFNIFVYSYTKAEWVKLNSYDFYWDDNTVNLPAYNNENVVFPNMRVTGFAVQQLIYGKHMAHDPIWKPFNVDLDYTWTTNKADYNVQWTSTGVDGGVDVNRYSSLRHRFGDIYLTPTYMDEYTVRFIDHNNEVLDTQKVIKGADALAPKDPTRSGYMFTGWDKEFTNIQGNLDVYATYKIVEDEEPVLPEKQKFKVQFIDHDGTLISEQMVEKGANALAPINPTRDGFYFVKWDKEYTNIQSDLIIQAVYEVATVVVPTPPAPELPTPPAPELPTPPAAVIPTPPTQDVVIIPVTRVPVGNTPVQGNQGNENVEVVPDQTIEDNQVPLAKSTGGAWALINLICSILTVAIGVVLVLLKHRKDEENHKDESVDQNQKEQYKRRRWTKGFAAVVAIASVVVFILTEDMSLPMQLMDKWTVTMFIILVIQVITFFIARHWKAEEQEDNTEKA